LPVPPTALTPDAQRTSAGEPTQGSIRARILQLTGGLLPSATEDAPAPGDPLAAPRRMLVPAERRRLPSPALPSVAYLLPGLPPEGSGGSHSLVQEARGLRRLGAGARVCVPHASLATAAALYGDDDGLFVPYPDGDSGIPGVSDTSASAFPGTLAAIGDADVVVATEYPSVDLLARLARERPRVRCAYYVQDYEPLFAAPRSSRADRALLSYRALPHLLLFAKTHWLRNLIAAAHGLHVAKVQPSLDRQLFHAGGRSHHAGLIRVAAMIRPRTPRRRPLATLRALERIARQLGDRVRIVTFGCDRQDFAELLEGGGASEDGGAWEDASLDRITHLGLLSRIQVSALMRRSDIFIDASAYQAFGRTGLEAMACGAIPLLPQLGGVHEYARHDENALILDDGTFEQVARAVLDLAGSPLRLARISDAGVRDARRFSIERAARSQLALFAAALS
jgi:glycosyltransferase involved in cell wall biosynthesis